MKRLWRRCFVWLATFTLCGIVVGEVALRMAGFGNPPLADPDPDIEYVLRPGNYDRFGNNINVNADRMRAPRITRPKPPRARRILLIGDSVVYGGHRLDQDETIAAQINALIAKQRSDRKQIRVLPIAASSWGPANMLAFARRYGVFEADEAWVVLSGIDLHDHPVYEDTGPYDSAKPFCAIHDVYHAVLRRFFRKQHPSPLKNRTTEPEIDALFGWLRDRGLTLRFFYHRTRKEIGRPSSEAHGFERMAAVARKHGASIGFTINTENTRNTGDCFADAIHPTPEGAAVIARTLLSSSESDLEADR